MWTKMQMSNRMFFFLRHFKLWFPSHVFAYLFRCFGVCFAHCLVHKCKTYLIGAMGKNLFFNNAKTNANVQLHFFALSCILFLISHIFWSHSFRMFFICLLRSCATDSTCLQDFNINELLLHFFGNRWFNLFPLHLGSRTQAWLHHDCVAVAISGQWLNFLEDHQGGVMPQKVSDG